MKKQKSEKTPILRIGGFCKKFSLPNLLIKDESENSFGTWKDRRSKLIIKKATEKGINKLAIITSGNAGYSLAKTAKGTGIKVVCIAGIKTKKSILKKLKKACHKLVLVDLSKKIFSKNEIIAFARENKKEKIIDVNFGFEEAYEEIIKEIKKEKPEFLVCPIGSGCGFVGLYKGIKKFKMKTILIGVRPKEIPSIADKLYSYYTPYEPKIKKITKEGHKIVRVSEKEILLAYNFAKKHLKCEPSSAAAFAALPKIKCRKDARIIVINSGKGLL